ncbi:MAG TPA: MASE1 domain-containing protein [bacterium]|nr:MASE1 domain-containing protein [bacterium]
MNETKHPAWVMLLRLTALTGLYVLAGILGRKTALLAGGSVLVWPPAGIALAGILLFGYRYWPGIALGSLVFSYLNHVPFGFFMGGTALGNAVGAVICAFFLNRFISFDNALGRTRDAVGYLFFACILGTTVNALFSAVGLLNDKKILPDAMFSNILEWWVPNALAVLVLTPFIITWATPSPLRMNIWRKIEAVFCGAGLIFGTLIAFNTWFVYGLEEYPLAYLPCPFLVWSALRFGPRGAATGTLLVAVLAYYSLLQGGGPFLTGNFAHSLRLVGSYIAIVAGSTLLLAGAATERRRALSEVLANEKRLRLVVADQQDLICRFLPDGRLTFANPAYCEFYSRPEAELLGKDFFKQLEPKEAVELREKLANLPADWPVCIFDRRSIGGDGHAEWQQYNIRRLTRDKLTDVEFQAVIQNVTARKRVEFELQEAKSKLEKMNNQLKISARQARDAADQANRANLAKSEFLANMSHEIRTPLSGLLGMVELLSQTRLDARQKEFAESATESANSLLHVINDVLDFSKIEAGKLAIASEEFSLRNVVDGVLENAATRAPEKKINLAAIVRRDVPHRLVGDPIRLRQVLLNLVANGIKFTEQGEVVVRVLPLVSTPEHLRLRFEVTDTGIGLTEEQTKKLFQPFMQVDTSSARKFGGTGLGLAISRKIVELMDGTIGVVSTAGNGATFWFELPVGVPPQPAIERSFPGLVFAQVLIASPNASLRESLSERLHGWAMDCRETATVEELSSAIQNDLQSTLMPVVLCDDEMLALGGAALRRQLSENREQVRSLLLAGPAATIESEEGDLTLFNRVLLKPTREQPLFEALVAVVAGQKPELTGTVRVPGDTRDTQVIRRETAAAKRTPISGLRILAAEDHPFNRKLCQMMLDTFGTRAEWAVNGREAVDKFRPGEFDAILMDCNMPEMDGHEATAAIRHIEVENKVAQPVRIIAITANALAGERERCLAAGMDDYITKPFTSQQLYQSLLAAVPSRPTAAGDFDPSRLEQLTRELNRTAVAEMVTDFLDELPDRLTEIHRLHTSKHWPDLKRAAHSLKGLFVLFGFQSLSDSFLALEEAAILGDAKHVGKFLEGLDAQSEAAVRQLQNWLKN